MNIQNYFFNAYAVTYFFSGIFVSAEAVFVYLQNRTSIINRGFAAVTICAGIWLTGVGFMFSSHLQSVSLTWSRYYSWFGIIFITPCLYLFSLVWAHKSIENKKIFLWCNFLSALAIYIVCFSTPYIVEDMWPYPWGYYPKAGLGHRYFLLWFSFQVFLIFRNFLYGYNHETVPTRKLQTKYIIAAFVFGVFMGSVDFLANYGFRLHSIGGAAIVIFSSIIAYSIINYKLMDIETVLHKTVLWILSFLIITVPIFLFYRMFFPVMRDSFPLQLTFGIASFIVYTLYLRLVQPKIDHMFQRRKADLERISSRFIEDLVHLKGMNNLVRCIDTTLGDTLYPQWIDIFVYNAERRKFVLVNRNQEEIFTLSFGKTDRFLQWMTRSDRIVYKDFIGIDPAYADIREEANRYFEAAKAAVVIPLVLDGQLLGLINLGRKTNLRPYSALEFNFLTILKIQSAIAISNSLIYQNIEEQVRQRTDELVEMQKQLVHVEKMATVGTLSGGVAHEINNPLTAILTNVQMLLAFSEGEEAKVDRESLELIEEATQRCRTIVQKLMTYAKKPMESGEMSQVNLPDVLGKVIAFLGFQLEQDDVKIITKVDDILYPVLGNHNELEQVLTNIILNARDAIVQAKKKGNIQITLSKHGEQVRMIIADEGAGISKENISKIFDPFFTTKDVGKGLGLGLSICQSIISKHNGRILVDSAPGRGTQFTIELPLNTKMMQSIRAL